MDLKYKITELVAKYTAERAYYMKEFATSKNDMYWASANRCSDIIDDLKKLVD